MRRSSVDDVHVQAFHDIECLLVHHGIGRAAQRSVYRNGSVRPLRLQQHCVCDHTEIGYDADNGDFFNLTDFLGQIRNSAGRHAKTAFADLEQLMRLTGEADIFLCFAVEAPAVGIRITMRNGECFAFPGGKIVFAVGIIGDQNIVSPRKSAERKAAMP